MAQIPLTPEFFDRLQFIYKKRKEVEWYRSMLTSPRSVNIRIDVESEKGHVVHLFDELLTEDQRKSLQQLLLEHMDVCLSEREAAVKALYEAITINLPECETLKDLEADFNRFFDNGKRTCKVYDKCDK